MGPPQTTDAGFANPLKWSSRQPFLLDQSVSAARPAVVIDHPLP